MMSFTRSAALNFLRVGVVAGLVSGFGALVAGMLFLAGLFLRSHALFIAALVALAVGLFGLAVMQGWRAYLLFNMGSWRTLGGRPTSRNEQPARFVTWVTLHGLLAATYGTAAGFMIWTAIFSSH
jgi:hypothetical protein